MTDCLDYFNEIVPYIITCPRGQHLASHELVCDFPLRKCVLRQRCFEIKCVSVFHVTHAKVQSLCQEGTKNSERENKCIERYTIASNTLKCKAVDFKTALGTWSGNMSRTSKSCSVPPSLANTLHLCGTTLPGHCHLQMQIWEFSERIALRQERILIWDANLTVLMMFHTFHASQSIAFLMRR